MKIIELLVEDKIAEELKENTPEDRIFSEYWGEMFTNISWMFKIRDEEKKS